MDNKDLRSDGETSDASAIAIVAMECRIPQADSVDALWKLLLDEKCTLTDLGDEQLRLAGVPEAVFSKPGYVKRAGLLKDIDLFDAGYFEIGAREADVLDVQQRLMLESSLTLLNRANIDPARYDRRIGVFAGSAFSSYLFGILERDDLLDTLGEMVIRHGNDKDFLATRVSYKLNLKGPSVNVQTSCSTGLVAVHSACQSLLLNECDTAIAGAVCVRFPQETGYPYQEDGVLSPDGNCRPFSADSNGTVFTNGLGLVLLKRLSEAVQDGDDVVAVIRASAINNDGATKVGFTAPSVAGQVEVLRDAIMMSGIDPADMQYVEAHGTGTVLGDPIEVEAIRQAYGETGKSCGIGSLKGNFGHFNIAAGVIGLIKAALILKHKLIPATLYASEVNAHLGLADSRFHVANQQRKLDTSGDQFVAVSAFGMGGTNSHVILQNREAPPILDSVEDCQHRIFTLSAKSEAALNNLTAEYRRFFAGAPTVPAVSFADAAHTAYFGRPLLSERIAFVARDAKEALALLEAGRYHRHLSREPESVAFVFAGQGTQHIQMGAELAKESTSFRENLDRVLDVFAREQGLDLAAHLWNPASETAIARTELTQPLLFAVEYALAETLIGMGAVPNVVLGHSLGELVAAAIAGVFDMSSAAAVVVKRAQCMAACEPGRMIVVDSLTDLERLVNDREIALAAHNAPSQYVVSGTAAHIETAIEVLRAHGRSAHRLATSHAFHSPMMVDAAAEFHLFMKDIPFGDARIPIVSNVTGNVLTEYEYKNPSYWSDHLVRTVQFAKSTRTLVDMGVVRYIAIGHGYAITNLLKLNLPEHGTGVVQALGGIDEEYASFLNVIAFYWTASNRIAIESFVAGRRKVALPVYPFDRTRHWVEPVIGFACRGSRPLAATVPEVTNVETATDPSAATRAAEPDRSADSTSTDNPVEDRVAEIYITYLGVDKIDRQLSFFELGGNSLLAIQLINRLRETFCIDIPLRGFYESSSIAELSRQVANRLLEAENV
ncbi:beta-ketoacyl synthase N-terminal-like domain-containing protein [Burkholderia anthina]|uniref:type I polyketide synthase n=1 Tax=Burkholderia anthina TaxID=179879 RepID=UPI00158F5E2A|nr:type I polyketide synthase [Burkholderia anthina]